MNTHEKDLYTRLDDLGIKTVTYEHEPLFTVEQAKNAAAHIPGVWCKNLFLKDDKKRFYLVVALATTKIELKKLAKTIDAHGLRFADADSLRNYLGVEPGSVTPFGVMLDTEHVVTVILDTALYKHEGITLHPLRNTASLVIAPADIRKFIIACGTHYKDIDFYE